MAAPSPLGPVGDLVRHNIRRLREQQRLKQSDMAERLRAAGRPMLVTVVSKTERGERRIDVDDLAAFASALGVSAARLLEPPTECATCHGTPPPGFSCLGCGTTGTERSAAGSQPDPRIGT